MHEMMNFEQYIVSWIRLFGINIFFLCLLICWTTMIVHQQILWLENQGSIQFSEHSKHFVERLLCLLYWTTVRSERSLNRSKRQIGVFAIANKDGGAYRVCLITQKYPIASRLWAILVTHDRLLNSDRSARRLFAVANRKQNVWCVRWTERAPGFDRLWDSHIEYTLSGKPAVLVKLILIWWVIQVEHYVSTGTQCAIGVCYTGYNTLVNTTGRTLFSHQCTDFHWAHVL